MLVIRPLFVDVGKAYDNETEGVEIDVNCPSALYLFRPRFLGQ